METVKGVIVYPLAPIKKLLENAAYKSAQNLWESSLTGRFLFNLKPDFSPHSYILDRNSEVIIARLKTGKFGLNYFDSSRKLNHNTCCPRCNHAKESAHHFFFDCPSYDSEREILFSKLFAIYNVFDFDLSIKNLLGNFSSPDMKVNELKE